MQQPSQNRKLSFYVCNPALMPSVQMLQQLPAHCPFQTLSAQPKAAPWMQALQPPLGMAPVHTEACSPSCHLDNLILGSICSGTHICRHWAGACVSWGSGCAYVQDAGRFHVQAEESWLVQGFEFWGQQNIMIIIILLTKTTTIINSFPFIIGINFTGIMI